MSTRPKAAAAGVLAVAVLSGCGVAQQSGRAAPDPAAETKQTGELALAQRTKELTLHGVDPCRLLTDAQLDELKENGLPELVDAKDQRDGPTCAFRVDAKAPHYTYYLETITTADLQDWLTGKHKKSSMTKEPVNLPGFPALKNYRAGERPQDCETLVGVAPGQTLRAQMAPTTEGAFDQRQMCDMATQVASMALQTLEARK
ncbi:DUF3558 domain-containing protein [Amycolatopsis anabasis]|uniref:DUF3558 domain-containing protein n=1 Tax=Amycolatopsis anabasis TaxID=1840409 RepID=UPI001FE5541E|nr:DUF3558 domain-containing protein [Amycolatopsis anabasis]